MKTKGRPKSRNIEDRRSPFGTTALSPMSWESKVEAHYRTTIKDAAQSKSYGNKLTKPARNNRSKKNG